MAYAAVKPPKATQEPVHKIRITLSSKNVKNLEKEVRDTALGAKKDIQKKKKLRSRQKKLKAYDLSNLSHFLPDIKTQEQPPPVDNLKLNPKMQKLILKEGNRFAAVLNHHAFQSDPLGSIHRHLLSTQPIVNEEPKKKIKKNIKTKRERKKSKASSGPQSMDIG